MKYTNTIFNYLLTASIKSYISGKKNIYKEKHSKSFSKSTIKLSEPEPEKHLNPQFKFNLIDKEVINLFKLSLFKVASVGSFELQEKLKSLAIESKTNPEIKNPTEYFKVNAFKLITQYVPSEKWPRGQWLETNLRTATRSSFYAARYNKLQDPELLSVYPAYRYKTQEDERVRDEHAILNDSVYLANDPIWNQIWPPNGWNCRCYIEEIDAVEFSNLENTNGNIQPTNHQQRKQILNNSKIPDEFQFNPANGDSILNKWSLEKLTDFPLNIQDEIIDSIKTNTNIIRESRLSLAAQYSDEIFKDKTMRNFIKKYKITEEPASLIKAYTSRETIYKNVSYKELNSSLDGRTPLNSDSVKFKIALEDALYHLPGYRGISFRGLNSGDYSLTEGDFFSENKFISSSLSKNTAEKYGTKYVFIITSKNGKLIKKQSLVTEDEEVIFLPHTLFRIQKVKKINSTTILEMVEL